eukprot:scaffold548541_cov16-Prasinocladus_malaysianus.AAC.1
MAQEITSSGAPAGSAAPDRRVAEPGGKAGSSASLRLRARWIAGAPSPVSKARTKPQLGNRGTDRHRTGRNKTNVIAAIAPRRII